MDVLSAKDQVLTFILTQLARVCMCTETLNETPPSCKKKKTNTCPCLRKSLSHTCQSLSWPAAHSKRAFLLRAHSCFIEDFQAGSRPPLSHVLAEQYAGTFHQSADRDGSSGIILTVSLARIRLYGATRPSTHTHTHTCTPREESIFFMLDRRHANNKHNAFLLDCNGHSLRRLLHRCKHAKR